MAKNKGLAADFAHLLGFGAKASDDEEDKKRDEQDAASAEEEKDDPKAEEERDEERDGDEQDEEDKEEKDAAASDDEDPDDEMDGKSKAAAARRRERARCAAIFAPEAAGVRPDVAAHLAFRTTMKRQAAVALLVAVASGKKIRGGLDARMTAASIPNIGDGGGAARDPGSPQAKAEAILAAGRKRRGEQ